MTLSAPRRLLLLFALLMRVLVPAGFMLDPADAAYPTLVACDGQGPIFAAPPHHSHQHANHGRAGEHGDCPYSAAAGAGEVPSEPPGLSAIIPPVSFLATPGPDHRYRPSAAAALPPATGPPFFVRSLELTD